MDAVRDYLLRVISAAIIISIINSIIGKKGSMGTLIRFIGGTFLALTLVQPLIKFDWSVLTAFAEDYTLDAQVSAAMGEAIARDEYESIIKSRTEAYILDKARDYSLDLEVEVMLCNGDPPIPESVRIQGNISPYAKQVLKKYICEDLGIREEAQQWIP